MELGKLRPQRYSWIEGDGGRGNSVSEGQSCDYTAGPKEFQEGYWGGRLTLGSFVEREAPPKKMPEKNPL